MDFNPNVDDFNSTYPNIQPYESRGDNRYYIAAAWNDVSEVPNRFTAGDESRAMAMRVVVLMKHISMLNLIDSLVIVTM